jgi:hypothetical protein
MIAVYPEKANTTLEYEEGVIRKNMRLVKTEMNKNKPFIL